MGANPRADRPDRPELRTSLLFILPEILISGIKKVEGKSVPKYILFFKDFSP
jgi:hypothetical protein